MWVCAHLGVFILWVNIPELGEGWGKWRGWVAFGFGGARSAVGWACVAPRCGHLITPADSRAALVGRVWPWPARLSATRRRQATTILTSRVISRHFPALHRRHRSAATLRSADFQSAALRLTHNTARSPQLHCSDDSLRTKVRAPFDAAPTSMNAKGQTHDHSRSQVCSSRGDPAAQALRDGCA